MKKQSKLTAFIFLIAVAAFSLSHYLTRPIWFDEAWSIMVYAMGPFGEIYTNYNAPNNHILFNMLLSIWLDTIGSIFPISELPFRLLTAATAIISISLMFKFWWKRLGGYSTFLTILCFIVSTPFMIYGTAVRGYMLSFVMIILALESGLRLMETQDKKYALYYFLSALGAIAVIPSNLFVFALIAIFPMKKSEISSEFLLKFIKERWLTAFLPLAAFLIFYSPILPNLYQALKHNNGWLHPLGAAIHLYSAILLSLLPIILLSFIGFIILLKQKAKNPIGIVLFITIIISPLIVILSRKPAPFPRVFFQLWPIVLFLSGLGIKHIFGYMRLKKALPKTLCIRCSIATLIIISWGIIHYNMNPIFSTVFTRKFSHDDFFQPAYMKKKFNPLRTVNSAIKLTGKKPRTVFLSQNSDFISLIFYGKLMGLNEDFWIPKYPSMIKMEVAKNADKFYIVARDENDLYLIKEQFNIKHAKPIETKGLDKIFEVKNERIKK